MHTHWKHSDRVHAKVFLSYHQTCLDVPHHPECKTTQKDACENATNAYLAICVITVSKVVSFIFLSLKPLGPCRLRLLFLIHFLVVHILNPFNPTRILITLTFALRKRNRRTLRQPLLLMQCLQLRVRHLVDILPNMLHALHDGLAGERCLVNFLAEDALRRPQFPCHKSELVRPLEQQVEGLAELIAGLEDGAAAEDVET